jgi:hypothetical protein
MDISSASHCLSLSFHLFAALLFISFISFMHLKEGTCAFDLSETSSKSLLKLFSRIARPAYATSAYCKEKGNDKEETCLAR